MASVKANLLCEQIDDDTTPVCDPSASPSWTLRNEHCLRQKPDTDGYTVEWTCQGAPLLSHTVSTPISATTLAYFPDISQKHQTRTGSLCTASGGTVTICASSVYNVDCLTTNKFSDARITGLFPANEGLIIEVSASSSFTYHYMSHPLHEIKLIDIPHSHKLIHVSTDLPLITSVTDSTVHFWATEVTLESALEVTSPVASESESEAHAADDLEPGDDAPILHPRSTTVVLTKAHEMDVSADSPARVLVAHDLRGLPVVCLVASGSLTGLSIGMNDSRLEQLVPSFKIRDVCSAVPILSIRKHQGCLDILVQSASDALSLYAGRNRLCSVELDNLPASPFFLVGAVGSNFGTRPIQGMYGSRYSLSLCCFVCPLINDCLAAISFVLESSGASRRLACIYQELIKARSALFAKPSSQGEWELFESAILRTGSSAYPNDTEDRFDKGQSMAESSWSFLVSDKYHGKRETTRRLKLCPRSRIAEQSFKTGSPSQNTEALQQIFQALHLLYEDYKLDSHKKDMLRRLVPLPARAAVQLGATAFLNHYRRDFPFLLSALKPESSCSTQVIGPVPSIMENIVDRIQGFARVRPYPVPSVSSGLTSEDGCNVAAAWRNSSPYELSRRICAYYDTLYDPSTRMEPPERKSDILLSRMTQDVFTREDLDSLPLGVCLPLRDTLFIGRVLPRLSATTDSLALLSREDMLQEDCGPASSSENKERFISETTAMLRLNSFVGRADSPVRPRDFRGDATSQEQDPQYVDEYDTDDSPHRRRFCDDRRIHEVSRILRSTDETVISPNMTKPAEPSADFDLASQLKQKLEILVRKRLAAPIGRGAFTLRTFVPSDPTKPLFIPKLCTTGKLLGQKGARVTLAATDTELLQWGEFHNGVAAGLRIIASSSNGDQEVGHILSRTWIVNHRPEDMVGCPGHAGMLLACGLGGYLPALKRTDYYQYLLSRHQLTSIGLMLGLSVCNTGSMDEKITKMLCLHIRSFNVAGFAVPDFHVSVNTQTAAVLGLGMLHKSSVELGVVQGLMQELAYKPKPGDAIDNREALALAAGLGIGLVCLGKGSAIDAAESGISERLLTLANGGLSKSKVSPHGNPLFERSGVDENGLQGSAPLAESETSRIDERGKLNTDVASPGALLALALIYVKTNDARLAERIQLPNTLYSLDRLKPLHVYLVVLVRSLIMWNSISATADWLAEVIPSLLHGVSPCGESNPMNLHGKVNVPNGLGDEDIDVDGLLQARAFAIAGAWTAIALRYAGTCDSEAVAIIKAGCESFEDAIRKSEDSNIHIQWVYMTCMSSAALSLSIVTAGSGNLDIFRILRRLRKICAPSLSKTRYGFHLAIHLAIGFLFLGGGCLTFGSSNDAIFGLLCAIYPHFPLDVNDNRYHLQAFRHLYVLSVEPRCIETRDVDTGKSCSVDVKLRMQNGTMVGIRAPCIVPDASSITEVIVASERYMPRSVRLNPPTPGRGWFSHTSNQVVFVKRRVGHLPHESDPKGSRSILSRTFPCDVSGITLQRSLDAVERDLASLYGADPDVLSFDLFYCRPCASDKGVAKRHKEVLQECLAGDKTAAMYHSVDISRIAALLKRSCIDPVSVSSLDILSVYTGFDRSSKTSLLRPSLVASVLKQASENGRSYRSSGLAEEDISLEGLRWSWADRGGGTELNDLVLSCSSAEPSQQEPAPAS